MGNFVLFPAAAREPQGAWLSMSPDHTLSGGHIKAAGPMLLSVTLAVDGLLGCGSLWALMAEARARPAPTAILVKCMLSEWPILAG